MKSSDLPKDVWRCGVAVRAEPRTSRLLRIAGMALGSEEDGASLARMGQVKGRRLGIRRSLGSISQRGHVEGGDRKGYG